VAGFVSVIVAPGSTAPLGSLTTPRSEVEAICARTVPVKASNNTTAATDKQRLVT